MKWSTVFRALGVKEHSIATLTPNSRHEPTITDHHDFCVEPLEPRFLLSGVTLITHGYAGDTTWVEAMQSAIVNRIHDEFSSTNVYESDVRVDGTFDTSAPLQVTHGSFLGDTTADKSSGEIVLTLDWTDVDAIGPEARSTTEVAQAVIDALLQPSFFSEWGSSVFELPIHLIGHSRGSSLVSEMSRLLGEIGVWLDQVTFLDPHPVQAMSDGPVNVYENVIFADNYYQDHLFPTGESIGGTAGQWLTPILQKDGLDLFPHSAVHDWYHGTIDLSFLPHEESETISRSKWYDAGDKGYQLSRIVGSNRLSTSSPTAKWGYHEGLGGWGLRVSLETSNAEWPNLMELVVSNGTIFTVGEDIKLEYSYQDYDSSATAKYYLDIDRNPYNGNEVFLDDRVLQKTGAIVFTDGAFVPTQGVEPNDYFVFTRITDGTHNRYAYTPDRITFRDDPVTLEQVTISGASEVSESNSTNYLLTASYSDGSTQDVTSSASWTVDPDTYVSITNSGVLSTYGVPSDKEVIITASYGGRSDDHSVTITSNTTNLKPTIGWLSDSPDQITQGDNLTLVAHEVTDPDSGDVVTKVEFYRDSNDNGKLDVGTDVYLGDGTSSDGDWTWTGSTGDFPIGVNRYFARAWDGDAWSNPKTTSGRVNRPAITVSTPNGGESWERGTSHNIRWSSVGDTGEKVFIDLYKAIATRSGYEFYQTITASTSNDGVFRWDITPNLLPGSDYRIRIQSTINWKYDDISDDDFSITMAATEPPSPAGVSATDGTYTDKVHVTWDSVSNATSYEVWRFTSNNFESATRIGNNLTSTTYDDASSTAGTTYYYWVKAKNSVGTSGFSTSDTGWRKQVNPEKPTIESLTASPDPIIQTLRLTLTASVSDNDGSVELVKFYRDSNSNGTLETGTDEFLGSDTSNSDGWKWNGSTSEFSIGTNHYFAQAQDDDGVWSDVVSTTGTVNPWEKPIIDLLSANPNPVVKGDELTLTANGVRVTAGAFISVAFYHDSNKNGQWDFKIDQLVIGETRQSGDTWTKRISTADLPQGTNRFFARARDRRALWSDPVSTTVKVILNPEIEILGNQQVILDEDTTPSSTDHTNFRRVSVGENRIRTFTIRNTGGGTLNLSDSPPVEITGRDSNYFEVVQQPDSIVRSGDFTTFKVRFAPGSEGLKEAAIHIANNDLNEHSYDFAIKGTGEAAVPQANAPEIEVRGRNLVIESGDTSPQWLDGTSYGKIGVGTGRTRTFMIRNTGNSTLNLSGITIGGPDSSHFKVILAPATFVAVGESTKFRIRFNPGSVGLNVAVVRIANDDPDEDPYNFAIRGKGLIV